jgi:hypothetical protein
MIKLVLGALEIMWVDIKWKMNLRFYISLLSSLLIYEIE